jgi:hypothetical protein
MTHIIEKRNVILKEKAILKSNVMQWPLYLSTEMKPVPLKPGLSK